MEAIGFDASGVRSMCGVALSHIFVRDMVKKGLTPALAHSESGIRLHGANATHQWKPFLDAINLSHRTFEAIKIWRGRFTRDYACNESKSQTHGLIGFVIWSKP